MQGLALSSISICQRKAILVNDEMTSDWAGQGFPRRLTLAYGTDQIDKPVCLQCLTVPSPGEPAAANFRINTDRPTVTARRKYRNHCRGEHHEVDCPWLWILSCLAGFLQTLRYLVLSLLNCRRRSEVRLRFFAYRFRFFALDFLWYPA
jgi:hypothetical protein